MRFLFFLFFFLASRNLFSQELSEEEQRLYTLIMQYRNQNGLKNIPLSSSLTYVAQLHCRDLEENIGYLTHAWSNCKYESGNSSTYPCMWDKPKELTKYKGYGYECAHGGNKLYVANAESALNSWKNSSPHNAVILNQGIWNDNVWNAIGIGIYKNYAVIWFGEDKDITLNNFNTPQKINKPNNNTNNSNFKPGVQPTPFSNSKANKSKTDSKKSISKQKSDRDKLKKEFENKTTFAPYFSTSTITSTDINELISNSVYHAGLEFEVPFHESKRYYFGIFTKTGFFIFPPTNNLPSKMNLNGITNQNNVSLIPNQEIGMVFFKHLKLGMGSFFDYRNSQLFYSNYFSASIGLKFDEYELELGSRYQNVMQQYQFFPSATLKIKPQR